MSTVAFSSSSSIFSSPLTAKSVGIEKAGSTGSGSTGTTNATKNTQDTVEISERGRTAYLNQTVKTTAGAGGVGGKNTNLLIWRLGFGNEGNSGMYTGALPQSMVALGRDEIKSLNSDISDGWKEFDSKISSLLESNNIKLTKKETLNFKIDQSGAITVGEGVDKMKASQIEKALNSDEMLGKELLLQHAKKALATPGLIVKNVEAAENVRTTALNNILETEAGGSISDLSFDAATGKLVSTSGNEKVDALLAEEPDLASELTRLVQSKDPDKEYSYGEKFEASFSFKNGTVIDQELAGKAALGQRVSKAFNWLEGSHLKTTMNYDKQGNQIGGDMVAEGVDDTFIASFTEDALRLHQFETGDAEDGEHQLKVTGDQGKISYQVVSPEADAKTTEEIENVGQEVLNYLENQIGAKADGMELKVDSNNKLGVKFGGENGSEELFSKAFDTAMKDPKFQEKTDELLELLQKLHTDKPHARITGEPKEQRGTRQSVVA